MSILRPKTIILSAQSLRPVHASVCSDSVVFLGQQTVSDYDSLIDDDEDLECTAPRKRCRLNFLSPQEKMVRRLVQFLLG